MDWLRECTILRLQELDPPGQKFTWSIELTSWLTSCMYTIFLVDAHVKNKLQIGCSLLAIFF
jgi:hypothetical protein